MWRSSALPAAVLLLAVTNCSPQALPPTCPFTACLPDSGNILIARGDKITANSTCGLQGTPERYHSCTRTAQQCVEETCDASDPALAHPPGDMALPFSVAEGNKTWWQSSLGDQVVTIEVQLEALFYFTHFVLTFRSARPAAMVVELSRDFGTSYQVQRYFAYDCRSSFGLEEKSEPTRLDEVVCSSQYSGEDSDEIVYRALSPNTRIPVNQLYSDVVTRRITLTNLRITFQAFGNYSDYRADPLGAGLGGTLEYYSLYSWVLRGWCFCYSHATKCDPLEGVPSLPGSVNPVCRCIHNTMGQNCEMCLALFNDRPWQPGNPQTQESNECKKCQCYGHAESCHYDPQEGHGVCDNCTHNTTGLQCDRCQELYFRRPGTLLNDPLVCQRCTCEAAGSKNNGVCVREDDAVRGLQAGQCFCKSNVDGGDADTSCDSCKAGYFNLSRSNPDGCEECNCSAAGSLSDECDQTTGQCQCKPGVTGLRCDRCKVERCCLSGSNPEGCEPCNCDVGGSLSPVCDPASGQCPCRRNIIGVKCDTISPGTFVFVSIEEHPEYNPKADPVDLIDLGDVRGAPRDGPFGVRVVNSTSTTVELGNTPTSGYTVVIYFGTPNTTEVGEDSLFDVTINSSLPHNPGNFLYGSCASEHGSSEDGSSGVVALMTRVLLSEAVYDPTTNLYVLVLGSVCVSMDTNYTVEIAYNPGDTGPPAVYVDRIDLNPDPQTFNLTILTVDVNCSCPRPPLVCRSPNNMIRNTTLSVQCDDPLLQTTALEELSCVAILVTTGVLLTNGSLPCECDKTGSLMEECETINGQCPCQPGVGGRRCDRCLPQYYGFSEDGCKFCSCNTTGSAHSLCDASTGQCSCLTGITGRSCDRCHGDHFGYGPNGCTPCRCNRTGSVAMSCNDTGVCGCQTGVTGDKCDRCAPNHFGFSTLGCQPCECDQDGSRFTGSCDLISGQCPCKEGVSGRRCDGCDASPLGPGQVLAELCIDCYCNGFSTRCSPAAGWFRAELDHTFRNQSEAEGWTSNGEIQWNSGFLSFTSAQGANLTNLEISFPAEFLGDKRTAYGNVFLFSARLRQGMDGQPVNKMQLELESKTYRLLLRAELDPLKAATTSTLVPLLPEGFSRVGFLTWPAQEHDLRRVLADLSAVRLVVTVPNGLLSVVDLFSVHLDYVVLGPSHLHVTTPLQPVHYVEQCECGAGREGQFCELCAPGYTRDPPNRGQFANCVRCFCFGHSDMCHTESNVCFNCSENTTGDHCEGCVAGYYRNHTANACLPCPCYGGPGASNQFTDSCQLTQSGQVVCDCPEGFLGSKCEQCAPGFHGDPTQPTGNCRKCSCHDNAVSQGPSCDRVSGVCNCAEPYTGDECEHCQDGYYGNATQQMCRECTCHHLGTVSGTQCDRVTGQCVCNENVTGRQCDECVGGTFGLPTLGACVSCDCCPSGVTSANCTMDFGECSCAPGYAGEKCCDCADGYYDNGSSICVACACPTASGAALDDVCDKSTGQCSCKEGVSGRQCNMCLPNTSGLLPLCEPCDECFERWETQIETFLRDVRIAITISGELNITLVPVEDLFVVIDRILHTLDRSNIQPEEYNRTHVLMSNLTTFVEGLIVPALGYSQRLRRAEERDAVSWNKAAMLNATLHSLMNQLPLLNRSYPILDWRRLLEQAAEGRNRSDQAQALIDGDIAKLTNQTSVQRSKYATARQASKFEELKDELERSVIAAIVLFDNVTSHLDTVTREVCQGKPGNCTACGGTECEVCSAEPNCDGLYSRATLAVVASNESHWLAQRIFKNLSESIPTLRSLLQDMSALLTEATDLGVYIQNLTSKANHTRTVVQELVHVLGEAENLLGEVDPAEISHLENETLSYSLSRTPEQVLELLFELNSTLHAFPPLLHVDREELDDQTSLVGLDATAANSMAGVVLSQASSVREELQEYQSTQGQVAVSLAEAEQDMPEARNKTHLASHILDRVERDLNETDCLLDKMDVLLTDAEHQLAENELRLLVVRNRSVQTQGQAATTQEETNALRDKLSSLQTNTTTQANATRHEREETENLRARVAALNRKSIRQQTEAEDMLQCQDQLRRRQRQVRDDVQSMRIELDQLADEISTVTNRNTGCLKIGGAGK